MNSNIQSQAKKIKTINKLIPTGNTKNIKNPSYNMPMGTPIQSKRPFTRDNEKSPSYQNKGNLSARGSQKINMKVSSSNFGANNRNDNSKSSYLDANNSFRMNSAGKKIDSQRKSVDSAKKTNSSLTNLYGAIKGKILFIYLIKS